jgi:hypothetical protein
MVCTVKECILFFPPWCDSHQEIERNFEDTKFRKHPRCDYTRVHTVQEVPTAALMDITNSNTEAWLREKLTNITTRLNQETV